jgi:hypothetical protein
MAEPKRAPLYDVRKTLKEAQKRARLSLKRRQEELARKRAVEKAARR